MIYDDLVDEALSKINSEVKSKPKKLKTLANSLQLSDERTEKLLSDESLDFHLMLEIFAILGLDMVSLYKV